MSPTIDNAFDIAKKWDYENGFYLTSDITRMSKILAHYELYKKIHHLPGHVLEFGVYKGASLIQWLTFRDILESSYSRKIIAFDAFGKFPSDALQFDQDRNFIQKFESAGGDGITKDKLEFYLKNKNFVNYELLEGNINFVLEKWLKEKPELRFSLVHIDVDIYEASKTILNQVLDRVVKGGLVVFDDYGTVLGETLAIEETDFSSFSEIRKLPISHIPSYAIKL
jgi:hypothetical protein